MRMLKLSLSLILASSFATTTLAATTICKIESKESPVRVLSWDTDSKKAKAKLYVGELDEGRVVMTREHNSGLKTNLRFPGAYEPGAELEFMVFPVSNNLHRVVSVGYRVVSGTKVLDTEWGNFEALCSTL